MIPKISKGSKPVGLMKYLVCPGRANEHTDPHLINGSRLIMAWHDDAQLSDEAAVEVARELDLNRRAFELEVDTKHVWHCSLSIPYQDREVSNQEWADIAQRFMDEMDFTDAGAKSPCQWVAVHHGKSVKGNDHIHIVASMVREDGTKWNAGNDFVRAQNVARGIKKDFNLIQLGNHSERWVDRAELERHKGREPLRFGLERTVRACGGGCGVGGAVRAPDAPGQPAGAPALRRRHRLDGHRVLGGRAATERHASAVVRWREARPGPEVAVAAHPVAGRPGDRSGSGRGVDGR